MLILPRVIPQRDIVGTLAEVAGRDTIYGILAHGPPSEDPLAEHADDGDKEYESKVGGQFAVFIGEVETNGAVDDPDQDDGGSEVAMDLAEEGRGSGLLIGAMVEEAEGWLYEDEKG